MAVVSFKTDWEIDENLVDIDEELVRTCCYDSVFFTIGKIQKCLK